MQAKGSKQFPKRLGKNWQGDYCDDRGRLGGLLVAWRSSVHRATVICKNSLSISLVIEGSSIPHWLLSVIYISNVPSVRYDLWVKLSDINLHDVPWLACGNFNIICNPEDMSGGRPFLLNDSVSTFRDFIFRSELLDLGFKGPKFI